MYVDRLLEMGLAKDWGICGVGVMPADRKMAEVMAAQDGLYTLLLENPDGTRDARVIGSIVDYRYAPDDPESVIELLAAPSTRIISLTITEGGYNIDNLGDGRRQRVRPRRGGAGASSRPRHRIADDRVLRQHRGQRRCRPPRVHHLRRARSPRPRRMDERAHTKFPNSMVDRITPVTTPDVVAVVQNEFGVDGSVAGGRRTVHVVGARGRFLRWPPAVGEGRCADGRRRHAVRVDEAAAAQRQPPKSLLLRVSGGLSACARCGG